MNLGKTGGSAERLDSHRKTLSVSLHVTRRVKHNAKVQSREIRLSAKGAIRSAASLAPIVCATSADAFRGPNLYRELEDVPDDVASSHDYDILGLAQSMLDASVESVPDELLAKLQVPKGGRR